MHQSIKREQHVPASSPPKKAKAPAPGTQMIAPSGSSPLTMQQNYLFRMMTKVIPWNTTAVPKDWIIQCSKIIDNSPVDVSSSNSYETSTWTYCGQNNVRKKDSDIAEFYEHLTPEDSTYMTLYQSLDKSSLLVGKKRKEATQQEKRELAKQFLEAKKAECQSWFDNDVFEIVDLRKIRVRNFVKGRWVLTVKKDKDGKFLKCNARWVVKGFQANRKILNKQSPAASRSGFMCLNKPLISVGIFIIWT